MTITSLHNNLITTEAAAYFDISRSAVIIVDVAITDPSVIAEARHWSGGQRGTDCELTELTGVELSPFIRQALNVGVMAIAGAGGAQDKFELKQLISDVGDQTSRAADTAAESTAQVVNDAARAIRQAAKEAGKAVSDAGKLARGEFAENVKGAQAALQDELRRLLGDDDPELQRRLDMVLHGFAEKVNTVGTEKTDALFAKAARQFDASDPTSPMAKQITLLEKQQTDLKANIDHRFGELTTQFEKLSTVVERAHAAKDARHDVEQGTTLKGVTYEQKINAAMLTIAEGLGDDYEATGSKPGSKSSSKKGDGVLRVQGTDAVLVVEMTDSVRKTWPAYLAAAESTRSAQASLGLVPNASALMGSSIRCLGPRRIVTAFDPDTADPELLRTVVQLLRLGAMTAAARVGIVGVDTADERLSEALTTIEKFDAIQKSANLIRGHANKIAVEAGSLQELLQRLLTEARTALSAAVGDAQSDAA